MFHICGAIFLHIIIPASVPNKGRRAGLYCFILRLQKTKKNPHFFHSHQKQYCHKPQNCRHLFRGQSSPGFVGHHTFSQYWILYLLQWILCPIRINVMNTFKAMFRIYFHSNSLAVRFSKRNVFRLIIHYSGVCITVMCRRTFQDVCVHYPACVLRINHLSLDCGHVAFHSEISVPLLLLGRFREVLQYSPRD